MSIIDSLPVPVSPSPPALLPPPDAEESSSGMSPLQVQCILKAFWKISLITSAAIMAASALAIKSMPNVYTATAAMLVHHDNKNPLAQAVAGAPPPETSIPTQIELITGPDVLQPVIDRLDLSRDKQFSGGFKGPPAELREIVLGNLSKALAVAQGNNGSQLLYIGVSYPDPNRAAQIANAIAGEALKQDRLRVAEPASERYAHYSHDLQDLKQKVNEAQERVTAFRKQHVLVDIDTDKGEAGVETAALDALQQKLITAQTMRRELEARQLTPDSTPEAVLKDAAVVALRAKLQTEQEQMAQLRQTLGVRHPSVMELQAAIDETRQSLSREVSAISQNVSSELDQARRLEAKYQAALDAQHSTAVERRSLRDEGAELQLQLESAQATYKRALDGYDAARFDSTTDNGNVTLVTKATAPAKADKPKKFKLFLMACLAALAVGVGGPFAYELLIDRRLRCRDDLERSFGYPVLAQFGPIGGAGSA